MTPIPDSPPADLPPSDAPRRASRIASIAACAGLALVLIATMLDLPEALPGLGSLVDARLPLSGVESRVTAVLLSFRGYDTMLEVAVLVLALLAGSSLGSRAPGRTFDAGEVARGLTRTLVPILILAAFYMLWRGSEAPGGAFQGGAMLSAARVLRRLTGAPAWPSARSTRMLAVLGIAVFIGVAGAAVVGGGHMLEYPKGFARPIIIALETVIAISSAAILASLFDIVAEAGSRPPRSQETAR